MSISPAACRTGLATVLATVPNIGQVHTYRRVMRTEGQVKAVLYDQALGRLQGWMVSPAANAAVVVERNSGFNQIGAAGGGNAFGTFQWQIEGYMGIDDGAASEQTFTDLAWSVALTLNSYGVVPVTGAHFQTQADVELFGYAFLANFALVHYCRIGIGIRGRVLP